MERSKSDRTPCTSLTIDEWPLNNGLTMVRFKQNCLEAGLLKLMVSLRRDYVYKACIDSWTLAASKQIGANSPPREIYLLL